jgi:signal peptidase I
MRSYSLNIANYIIRFISESESPDLVPGERFLRNICTGSESDIIISVHSGKFLIPADSAKVFDAPYVEEINGVRITKSDKFWSVHKYNDDLFIKSLFPLSDEKKSAVLKFSLSSKKWDLWFDGAGKDIDPLEYPLDGLILYYLTAIKGDIMIHASGVNNDGRGYLFSGVSGKGKTTMAKLWDNAGAQVIHDDRLIMRKTENGYKMHNTPVYNNDEPKESPLDMIFLIDHGKENVLSTVGGAVSISMVMANCIQHAWDPEIISRLLDSVSRMCSAVPVGLLSFKPDKSIVDYILEDNKAPENHIIVKDIGFSLLAEGTSLKVKADGYSMYPSIKPGSIVLIEPLAEDLPPSPGEIIAWKRESGFVVHRLVRIIKEGDNISFITRGDSCAYEDQPVKRDQIAGKVVQVESVTGRILSRGDKLIRKPYYLYNRLVVWVLLRIRKIL